MLEFQYYLLNGYDDISDNGDESFGTAPAGAGMAPEFTRLSADHSE